MVQGGAREDAAPRSQAPPDARRRRRRPRAELAAGEALPLPCGVCAQPPRPRRRRARGGKGVWRRARRHAGARRGDRPADGPAARLLREPAVAGARGAPPPPARARRVWRPARAQRAPRDQAREARARRAGRPRRPHRACRRVGRRRAAVLASCRTARGRVGRRGYDDVKDASGAKRKLHEISTRSRTRHAGDGAPPGVVIAARATLRRRGGARRTGGEAGEPTQRSRLGHLPAPRRRGARRRFAAGGGATVPSAASPSPSRSIAADCGGCRSATPRRTTAPTRRSRVCGACSGERRSQACSAAMRTSRRSWRRAWRCRLRCTIRCTRRRCSSRTPTPPKLSELLTLRRRTPRLRAVTAGGRRTRAGAPRGAITGGVLRAPPAVAEQAAPLKASLTPLSHALQLLGRGAITLRSAAACAALLPRGASDARARLAAPAPTRTAAAAPLSDRLRTRESRAAGRRRSRSSSVRERGRISGSPRRRRRWRWRRRQALELAGLVGGGRHRRCGGRQRARFGGSVSGAPPIRRRRSSTNPPPPPPRRFRCARRARVRRRAGGTRAAEHPAGDRPAPPRAPRERWRPARRRVRRAARDVRQADRRGRCGRRQPSDGGVDVELVEDARCGRR